jgi:transposase InsO family protein
MDVQQAPAAPAEAVPTPSTPSQPTTQTPPTAPAEKQQEIGILGKWLPHILEYERVGGNQLEFCKDRGICRSTFSGWWRRYQLLGEKGLRKQRKNMQHSGSWSPDERRRAVEAFQKSGMSITDFARTWGVGREPMKIWVEKYRAEGPKGLERRTLNVGRPVRHGMRALIEKVKRENPSFGFKKVRDFLGRIAGVKVSSGSVRNALKGKGYPRGARQRRREKSHLPRRFERACAGDLWQSDITSFVLPRHGQRVYLTVFLDDYSRYIVSWGLALQQKQELVTEALLAGIDRFGKPKEVLTDQGRQYFSWRGKGEFQKTLAKQGIQHVVARTHHPQTVGKTERYWATVMEEFWERVQPQELGDARERLAHFINHYNHFRPHQGIDGMVPADRFFGAESQVRKALESAMVKNELLMALGEAPRKPVYLVGQIGDQQVSMHGEKGRMVFQTPDGRVQEMALEGMGAGSRGVEDGRGRESREEEAGIQGAIAQDGQDPEQGGPPGAGFVGDGQCRGEGPGAPDGGPAAAVLDGEGQEGRGGGEAGHPSPAGVAVEPAGVVGAGGGSSEATQEG